MIVGGERLEGNAINIYWQSSWAYESNNFCYSHSVFSSLIMILALYASA